MDVVPFLLVLYFVYSLKCLLLDGQSCSDEQRSQRGFMLANSTYSSHYTDRYPECVQLCVGDPSCISLNFWWYMKKCDLNSQSRESCPACYVTESTTTYQGMARQPLIETEDKPRNVVLLSNVTGNKVCSGTVVKFTCTADASPSVHTYRLTKNGTVVGEGSSGLWWQTSTEGHFLYTCVAENDLGTEVSANSLVTVHNRPTIQPLANQALNENETLTLFCDVSGPLPFSVTWTYVTSGVSAMVNPWVITPFNQSLPGEYRCDASNECGDTSASTTITFICPLERVSYDGKCCFFPFHYQGIVYSSCTTVGQALGWAWCALTEIYDANKWDYC